MRSRLGTASDALHAIASRFHVMFTMCCLLSWGLSSISTQLHLFVTCERKKHANSASVVKQFPCHDLHCFSNTVWPLFPAGEMRFARDPPSTAVWLLIRPWGQSAYAIFTAPIGKDAAYECTVLRVPSLTGYCRSRYPRVGGCTVR